MKYLLAPLFLLFIAWSARPTTLPVVDADTPLYEVLRALGTPERADVMVRPVAGASAELGRRLVLEGINVNGGQQSAHFKCTSCHNVVREDPILHLPDPAARLAYASANNLPFLPGTTLWGAVNRKSYYNGDYEKKYGDLVKNARRDLRGAIQLCATECAQGQALDEVAMESVVAYLHTIGLRVKDLPETAPSLEQINGAISRKSAENESLVRELEASILTASPATFVLPPTDRNVGYPVAEAPDLAHGEALFQRSCLHCHGQRRYSFFELAESDFHYNYLTKHFPRYTRYSTYQVVRYGTSPIPGKLAYMPHYTAERMSDQQVEDLRAYLASKAVK
ncbi:cytochrome c [Neolewinella lacunae]|uniref:Cytochrome c n=1 Tax=Neolewinella lacunae TaxID=1517758 RepID=A0A923PKG0_9BACT|nr:cytochrome c [Neolewinella lacunae]MBC6995783.1 cytochrome c [Neolewinella lacunae]MDN3636524.1 cytochrome c [Neolewinella lacunae]